MGIREKVYSDLSMVVFSTYSDKSFARHVYWARHDLERGRVERAIERLWLALDVMGNVVDPMTALVEDSIWALRSA